MCLGVPGELLERLEGDPPTGRVAFGRIVKEVCLAFVPEVRVGEYVLVHAGTALEVMDEAAAAELLQTLARLDGDVP